MYPSPEEYVGIMKMQTVKLGLPRLLGSPRRSPVRNDPLLLGFCINGVIKARLLRSLNITLTG